MLPLLGPVLRIMPCTASAGSSVPRLGPGLCLHVDLACYLAGGVPQGPRNLASGDCQLLQLLHCGQIFGPMETSVGLMTWLSGLDLASRLGFGHPCYRVSSSQYPVKHLREIFVPVKASDKTLIDFNMVGI